MKSEFQVHLLNEKGLAKANTLGESFSVLLETIELLVPASREPRARARRDEAAGGVVLGEAWHCHAAGESEVTATPPTKRVLHIGKRFKPPAGTVVVRAGNKAARRVQRKLGIAAASKLDKRIKDEQLERADARDVAKKSHAARRLLERERQRRARGPTT